jgi:hypothetical protein
MDSTKIIDWYKKSKRRFLGPNGKKYKINFNKKPTDKIVLKFSLTEASTAPTLVEPPPTLDLRKFLTPVKDQGENGDSVAFSIACTKEYQNWVVNEQLESLSPWFIYVNANTTDPKSCDTGLDITQGFDVLKNIGIATEADLKTPINCPSMPIIIPENVITNAAKNKINNYHVISTIQELKSSLANYGPCPLGLPVYNYSSTFWKKNSVDKLQGGHCVSVVGYTEDNFIIRNSWGENWGEKGYSYWSFIDWDIQLELFSANNLTGTTIAPSITNPLLANPNALPIITPAKGIISASIPVTTPVPSPVPTIAPGILTPSTNTSISSSDSNSSKKVISSNKDGLSTLTIISIIIGCLILILIALYLFFMPNNLFRK